MSATKRNAAICDIEDDPDIMKGGTKERRKVKKKKKKKKKEKRRQAFVTLPPTPLTLFRVCLFCGGSIDFGWSHSHSNTLAHIYFDGSCCLSFN